MRDAAIDMTASTVGLGLASGISAAIIEDALSAVVLVSFVTLASRLLVLLVAVQRLPFSPRRIVYSVALAVLSAVLVAIVTLTLGVAAGFPLPIISALSTVFGAQPKILTSVLSKLGRRAAREVEK